MRHYFVQRERNEHTRPLCAVVRFSMSSSTGVGAADVALRTAANAKKRVTKRAIGIQMWDSVRLEGVRRALMENGGARGEVGGEREPTRWEEKQFDRPLL